VGKQKGHAESVHSSRSGKTKGGAVQMAGKQPCSQSRARSGKQHLFAKSGAQRENKRRRAELCEQGKRVRKIGEWPLSFKFAKSASV
jgi:hypothetical protein